jgi:hypothetical protein
MIPHHHRDCLAHVGQRILPRANGTKALRVFKDLLSFVEMVSGDTDFALAVIRPGFADFEDALQSV